jgi:tetratricopeptide (TPR) repeat protein
MRNEDKNEFSIREKRSEEMNSKTHELFQRASKLIYMGKLTLALEQYLKIHELEPEETTVITTIGDLYLRLGKGNDALFWYQKVAVILESRELVSNAIAIYKKILKFSPQNQAVMARLAELYGQTTKAKHLYKLIANELMSRGACDQAIATYERISHLDPSRHESRLELAAVLERLGRFQEANQLYLSCAELLVRQGNPTLASSVVENIFRLKPQEKEFLKSFFRLLQKLDWTERGVEYLESLLLDEGPESRATLLDLARRYLLGNEQHDPRLYSASMKLLEKLIARQDLNASLDVVDAIFETSIQQRDELTLKNKLALLLQLDESNVRTLKTLTALLRRINDRYNLEECLRRLLIHQLQSGNWREAKDSLNQMAVYGQNSFYLGLLNLLSDAIVSGSLQDLQASSQELIRALERGTLEEQDSLLAEGSALGVSELDLGLGIAQDSLSQCMG